LFELQVLRWVRVPSELRTATFITSGGFAA
jgi:hypothetical protein